MQRLTIVPFKLCFFRHHELSEAKGELIKLRADALEKAALFADQKKALESAKGSKLEETNKELQDQIKELQHQLEDAQAEYHLESEMQKEQFKDTQEDLRTSKKAIEQLEKKSAEASLEITKLKEELRLARIHSVVQVAPVAQTPEPSKSAPNLNAIPVDRIELAMQSLEEMKTQFSMLQWIHGKKTNDAKIKALEEQVKTLTKEKQALVDALVVRTIETPPRSMPSRKSSIISETVSAPTPSDTIPSAGPATTPMRKRKASTVATITTTTPNTDTADTLPDDTPHPKRMAIWDEDFEEFGDDLFEAAPESVIPTPRSEQGPSNSTSSTATLKAPTSKPKSIPVPAPPAPPPPKSAKPAKAKTTRTTKAKPVPDTFANIQIRNISLNPYIPEPSDTLNCKPDIFVMNLGSMKDNQLTHPVSDIL